MSIDLNILNELQLVVNTHIHRFENFYERYFNRPDTRELVQYFFNRIYTLEGKAERDKTAKKVYDRFRAVLSEKAKERIENLMNLNDLTDSLDLQMAVALKKNPQFQNQTTESGVISPDVFRELYRIANSQKDREEQLQLILHNLESFFELSKHPLAEMMMKPASMAAAMVGAKSIFAIFEEGYRATRPVQKEIFTEFMQVVRQKENQFLQSIYN
ncbi:MAG: hypothetical protein KDK38_10945 [Leptospiraceae bacterium]|nr:hypothetical protein [Leptospiraceae bacterium]